MIPYSGGGLCSESRGIPNGVMCELLVRCVRTLRRTRLLSSAQPQCLLLSTSMCSSHHKLLYSFDSLPREGANVTSESVSSLWPHRFPQPVWGGEKTCEGRWLQAKGRACGLSGTAEREASVLVLERERQLERLLRALVNHLESSQLASDGLGWDWIGSDEMRAD